MTIRNTQCNPVLLVMLQWKLLWAHNFEEAQFDLSCRDIRIQLTNSEQGLKTRMEIDNITSLYDGSYHYAYEFENYNSYDNLVEMRQSLRTMSLIVYCLAFVGVLGNGAVIWMTGLKMKKNANTVWFLNLAVANFLFTLFLPLSVPVFLVLDFHWPLSSFICRLSSTMNLLNMFASVYILVVISVDRCVSSVWPVWAQNHRSVRKASCVSLGVWVLALILSTRILIFKDAGPSYNNRDIINCFNNFAFSDEDETLSVGQLKDFHHQAMTITCFLLGFVVPFTVIVSCYAVIIHRHRTNRILASQSSRPSKVITAVTTTFFLCWAPYHIMALIVMVNHMSVHPSETLYYVTSVSVPVATNLAFFSSCLNPLMYICMGEYFNLKVLDPTVPLSV
ncbi:hypothetical protein L3Q82_013113 [Scortum barcoo]|uniref:Uncharacterized protein n=1 Tax=Scortum barcoo TaxID=214431 RepID=A0ACB8VZB6_9TELE|nr:hypothetical protein L3Q82_013113 [Scortum barcoo]